METKLKFSTHVRFVFGAVVVAFLGSLTQQPSVLAWLSVHPMYDSFIVAGGVAFHAYNTYAGTTEPA